MRKSSIRDVLRAAAAAWLAAAAIWTGSAGLAAAAPQGEGGEPGWLDVNELYRDQPRMLAAEVDGLRPGVKGRVELFAVLVALYPNQSVFLREVEAVGDLLARRFDAAGRVVTLANSAPDPRKFPLATTRNLAAAIAAVKRRMNLGEDVLLVYLTSHGGKGILAAGPWAVGTPPILAGDLAGLVDRARVPNLVAVIGACHSGSFVPSLAAPDRLVITAAAADRSSFGCSDRNDWTWFGKAFFDRALRETRSFPQAFERAAALVRQWETAEHFTPSKPQMAMGAKIGPVLDRLAGDAGS